MIFCGQGTYAENRAYCGVVPGLSRACRRTVLLAKDALDPGTNSPLGYQCICLTAAIPAASRVIFGQDASRVTRSRAPSGEAGSCAEPAGQAIDPGGGTLIGLGRIIAAVRACAIGSSAVISPAVAAAPSRSQGRAAARSVAASIAR